MNKKGFTLVEVIATVALLAILIGLAGTSLIKKYNESKKEAIIIQEGQLVQSGDMVIQDYCKDPLNEGYQLQCDDYFKPYVDSNKNLIVEDNTYTKYICVKDLKKLGYYSEELVYSGVDCSGVVIYKIDYETDLQKDSYSVIKCGEDYITEVENANDYLTNFKECFDTPSGGETGEGETQVAKEYLLTVNFTELTPNGMKVSQSYSKKYKKGDTVTVPVPTYSTVDNEYTPFKHGSSVNATSFNLSSDKTKLNGTMPEGNVTINIVYSASTYILTVNYKEFNNVQGNITFPAKQYTMFYGEEIEIPYEEKENFKVISPSDFTYEMGQNDDEIDVIYQQEKFNLTYNSNGGTACNSRQVIYNKAYGSLCSPTRTGYTFDGWYLNGEKVESTDINDNYSNITLTAKWIANKYVVIYNCNGGTPTSSYSSEHTYDQVSNLASNRCTKTGSVFTGWLGSNGVTYTNQQSIKNVLSENNSSITLTAQWTPLTYYVAFAANGGAGTMSKMTLRYGQVVNLTSNTFTRTGHRFDGWSGSDGKSYANNASITNLTTVHGSTITMTAKWTKCGAGTYLVNNVCTACGAGTYSAGGVNSCTACPAGKYTSSTGQSSCATCAAGTYNTGTGNTTCKSCDAGYYCTGGTHKAVCSAGTYTNTTGKSSCTTCAAGTYNTGTGNTTCKSCDVGYYCTGGSNKTACPAGKYSTGGASACTTCTAGYRCPGSSNRIQCSAGTFAAAGATTCSTCPAGKYSAAGASSCSTCAAGTYNSGTGNTGCSTCPAGYYCTGGSSLVACPAGKYRNSSGGTSSSSCTSCAKGSYSSSAGSIGCIACQGRTTSSTGQTSCNASCSNSSYVSSWNNASWSPNAVSNSCSINSCSSGYTLQSGSCVSSIPGTRVNFSGSYWSWRDGSNCKSTDYCPVGYCDTIGTATTQLYVESITNLTAANAGKYGTVHGWLAISNIGSIGAGGNCVKGNCASVCSGVSYNTRTSGGTTYVKVQLIDVYGVFNCAVNGKGC